MKVRDREVLDLLGDEPELLALADAVAQTQRPTGRLRARRTVAGIALATAALFALVIASPWDRGGGGGLILDRALAAIDARGPVVHLTVRLELSGGERMSPTVTTDSFYDKRRRTVRVVSRSEGKILSDYTTAAAEDEFTMFPGLLDGAEFYREALAGRTAKVVGKGVLKGRAIYWLGLEKGGGPGILHIGIDRRSYRPVVFRAVNPDGTPAGFQAAVLGFEYVSTSRARFQADAPVLVVGTVIGQDCRPTRARVGAFLSADPRGDNPRVSAEVASARTGPDGRFTLRADPAKSPFREALASASRENGGWLNFDLHAQGKYRGFGYTGFSRFASKRKWWDNETDQPEKPAPITIRIGGPGSKC